MDQRLVLWVVEWMHLIKQTFCNGFLCELKIFTSGGNNHMALPLQNQEPWKYSINLSKGGGSKKSKLPIVPTITKY